MTSSDEIAGSARGPHPGRDSDPGLAPAAAFALDPRISADSLPVVRLGLCEVRLHRDARYPWLLLIPEVAGAVEVLDLGAADQDQLWVEIRRAAAVLQSLYSPTKLNVAALGNQVPQLHVHVIARFTDDAAWPGPVWGAYPAIPYAEATAAALIGRLRIAFGMDL
jgi:diadenosine tetraphosphate (Ap4A) HIT family hydrolase